MSSQAHTVQDRAFPQADSPGCSFPPPCSSPGQTLPVREETPSPILQLIQGAQTPLCPAALGLAAPNGSAAAPDPPGFTHSSRDRALLQGWDLWVSLPHSLLSVGPHSCPAPAFPSPFPGVIWLKDRHSFQGRKDPLFTPHSGKREWFCCQGTIFNRDVDPARPARWLLCGNSRQEKWDGRLQG